MKGKLNIAHLLTSILLIQLLFSMLYQIGAINNKWVSVIPIALLMLIVLFITFAYIVFYKYITRGNGRWFGSDKRSDK